MRFHITAFALTVGIIWGGALFVVAVVNMFSPGYGQAFLDLMASVYPGYEPGTGFGSIVVGSLYGFVDGAIGGAIFAWLYNLISGCCAAGKVDSAA